MLLPVGMQILFYSAGLFRKEERKDCDDPRRNHSNNRGEKPGSEPVAEKANLYTDLGFDSLSFISLLLEIEEAYSILFGIMEMEPCLEVGHLIALVESKVKEREGQ